MNKVLIFSRIALNFSKILLFGSLGVIVLSFLIGICIISSETNKKVDPLSIVNICKEIPTLDVCKLRAQQGK